MKKSYLLLIIGVALMVITSCKKKEPAVPPVTPEPTPGTTQTMPYTQLFETDFGTYTTQDVLGDESWEIDYKTAKMTGYVGGENKADEDWLISSPVSVTGVDHAKIVMEYICRYFANLNSDLTLWASENYTYGEAPSTATWTQIPATLSEGSDWTNFKTTEISLDNFIGKTITVAVKYVSTTTKAGTAEIKSISIEAGQAGGGGGGQGGETQNMPYVQSFTDDFGTYTTKDVLGAESWEIAYSTAKMTGYVGGENKEDEDWLISSPVNVTGVEHAKIVMEYICRYFSNLNSDITIWASEDYVYDEMPNTATWAQIPATLSEGSDWTTFKTAEISLDDFIGKTITIAVKYVSTTTKAGTIEIKSISVEEGEAGGVTPVPPTPGPGTGSGTIDDPYNVASGISLQGQDVIGWVQGYIVGAVRNGASTVSSNDDVVWTAPFDSYTNVVIADDVTCTEITNCIIVNLPSGKPLRQQVNLYDNPDNYGKLLSVTGKLRTYFGQAGLRDSGGTENDFVLEGYIPPTPPTAIYSESFDGTQGDFEIVDVVLPEGLTYVWAPSSQYHCMKASAFVSGQAYETESWLVSPTIDLSGFSSAKLNFDHCCKYESNPQEEMTVWITNNYTGDVTTTVWDQIELSVYGSNFSWVNTGDFDLGEYLDSFVTIAFRYASTSENAPTWEVKNFMIKE